MIFKERELGVLLLISNILGMQLIKIKKILIVSFSIFHDINYWVCISITKKLDFV
jgi:hypothetical protein